MTDEDIRKLAQSYVDEIFAHDDMSDQENIENKNDALVMCMAFVGHILEKHCIVEKEKIKALYSKMELDGNHVDSDNDWAVYEAMDELEKIFGNELFYDTEK
ncbi:MAG: hypothetical protein K2N25_03385 [Muribaculaceae bacterium]|nr:hypothetical protein [Muribaculaceae bacterium]